MDLYRIISLETFIELLHDKRERYVRPAIWDDNYEGYLFGKINDAECRRKIIEEMYRDLCPRNYKGVINNLISLEHGKWFVYGQCWSKLSDSDALWRIYSYNNHSVQIRTTDKHIERLLASKQGIEYEKKEVLYDVNPGDDLLHKQVMQLKETKKIYEPFFHKREAFKHEEEIRVLIDDVTWYQMSDMDKMGANWKICEKMQELSEDSDRINEIERRLIKHMGHWKEEKIPDNYYVDIDILNQYILGIRVHPLAEKWYVKLIQGLCEEYEIQFAGQSDLYGKKDGEFFVK